MLYSVRGHEFDVYSYIGLTIFHTVCPNEVWCFLRKQNLKLLTPEVINHVRVKTKEYAYCLLYKRIL